MRKVATYFLPPREGTGIGPHRSMYSSSRFQDGVSCCPEVAGWDFNAIDHVLPDERLQVVVSQVSKATMPEFCRLGPWVGGQGCCFVLTAWDIGVLWLDAWPL